MTVGPLAQPTQYPGNGSATVFNYPGLITATTDLIVGFIVAGVYTQQSYGTYTIPANGIGNPGGCQVVFVTAPPGGTTVDLRSLIPETQPTNFANLGAYLPEANTAAVDRCVRQIQDLNRLTYLFGIHGPDTESLSWPALPGPQARAGTQLGFDPVTGLPTLITSPATAFTQSLFNSFLSTAVWYVRTQPEINASVIPVNYVEPPGNPYRQGATGNGATSDRAALFTQNSTGEQIYLTRGTYLVDSNLTISSAVWMESGAIFKIATGVTLFITGPFAGSISQHFQLVGTGIVQFGSANNQTTYVPVASLCPEYWGAQGVNGSGDDTAAVQASVNYLISAGRPVEFHQDYPVSQIVLIGNGLTIYGNGFALIGNATGATTSVLDIKCGYSTIRDLIVDANFNPLYQSAVHWYTNNPTYYPGFNRIYGLWTRNALIGLCIGALPTQSLPLPVNSTASAPGVANNAPLSESEIYGLQQVSCVNGLYMAQANGKLMISGVITGSHAGWSSYGASGYTNANTCALIIKLDATQESELALFGGSLEQNSEPTGTWFQVTNGHLVTHGTTLEATCPAYIAGNAQVTLSGTLDTGWEFPGSYTAFQVDSLANGLLNFTDLTLAYPTGNIALGNGSPFILSNTGGVGGSYAANTAGFSVTCSGVELRDIPLAPLGGATGYATIAQGIPVHYVNCKWTSYNSTPAITAKYTISDANELLANVVDQSAYGITAYGANGNATSGGWTAVVTGTGSWGSAASGITQLGTTIDKCLKLYAAAAGSSVLTSPKFAVVPQHSYLFRAWVQGGVTGDTITITIYWFNFAGTAASTASTQLLNVADTVIGATPIPCQFLAQPPKDATQAWIVLEAAGGATMMVTAPSLK